MKCKSCGAEITEDSSFCNKCGKKIENLSETKEQSSERGEAKKSAADKFLDWGKSLIAFACVFNYLIHDSVFPKTAIFMEVCFIAIIVYAIYYFLRSKAESNTNKMIATVVVVIIASTACAGIRQTIVENSYYNTRVLVDEKQLPQQYAFSIAFTDKIDYKNFEKLELYVLPYSIAEEHKGTYSLWVKEKGYYKNSNGYYELYIKTVYDMNLSQFKNVEEKHYKNDKFIKSRKVNGKWISANTDPRYQHIAKYFTHIGYK